MATLTITKHWANGQILLESDLDFIKNDTETFLNVTGIDDDNIQNAGITASSKLVDGTISTAKLQNAAITTAKIASDAITTVNILDANVTAAKLGPDVATTFTPPGVIWAYSASTAPSGWLLCDGSAISRTTYSALNTVYSGDSYPYGSGNGTTTFNIPDLRGRIIGGKDDMGGSSASRLTSATITSGATTLGHSGGEETHALTGTETQAHTHTYSGTVAADHGAIAATSSGGNFQASTEFHTHTYSGTTSGYTATGNGSAHNNVQPTLILNYIVKT